MSLRQTNKALSKSKQKELLKEDKKPFKPEDKNKKLAKTNEIEAKILEGEDHSKHVNNVKDNTKSKGKNNSRISTAKNKVKEEKKKEEENTELKSEQFNQQEANSQENPKEEEPKIYPKEEYLKSKISQENYNPKLISSINKGLIQEIGDLKTDFVSDTLNINSKTKDISKLLENIYLTESSLNKSKLPTDVQMYENKRKLKLIKDLKEDESILKKKYNKIVENEKLLKDECFNIIGSDLNPTKNQSSSAQFSLGSSWNKEKLLKLNSEKELISAKISDIHSKINNMIIEENNSSSTRKEKIKTFLDNFEKDKELIEIRAKKYQQESRKLTEKMRNDINKLIEKRKREFDLKEQKENEYKIEFLNRIKEQEKQILKSR